MIGGSRDSPSGQAIRCIPLLSDEKDSGIAAVADGVVLGVYGIVSNSYSCRYVRNYNTNGSIWLAFKL